MLQVDIRMNGRAIGGATAVNRGQPTPNASGLTTYECRGTINGYDVEWEVIHDRSDGALPLVDLMVEAWIAAMHDADE